MSRDKGNIAESKACVWLEQCGHTIVERNFYSKFGEIDIITLKEGVHHFIEVKSGRGFEAIYNITPTKVKKILKTVDFYRMRKKLGTPFCVDAIILQDDEIQLIENITF